LSSRFREDREVLKKVREEKGRIEKGNKSGRTGG
jgi:hypothetical protein